MNFRDIFFFIAIAFFSTWLVQFFFAPKQRSTGEVKTGQAIKVTTLEELSRPLAFEIDFFDAHLAAAATQKPDLFTVTVPQERVTFSSMGGTIQTVSVPLPSVRGGILNTMQFGTSQQLPHEQQAFLVALDQQTPLQYTFAGQEETTEGTVIQYRSESPQAVIEKSFLINKNIPRIDLTLTIEPRDAAKEGVRPRIFVPGPMLEDAHLGFNDMNAVVLSDRGTVEHKPIEAVRDQAWVRPGICGVESRYGLYALVGDKDHFVQRAYFMKMGTQGLTAIFEGPALKTKTQWTLSFYCGPKEATRMELVDHRLLRLLWSGWLGWLAKLIAFLLQLLYGLLGNYGWAIVIFAVVIRLLLLPLTIKGDIAMKQSQTKRTELERRLRHLHEKYHDDKEALNVAKLDLYRQYGGGMDILYSLLPNLVMLILFTGIQRVCSASVYLFKAPFFGFYRDLSAADPYYVLPALMGLFILVNMVLMSKKSYRSMLVGVIFALIVPGLLARLSVGALLFLVIFSMFQAGQAFVLKRFARL